jgi:hypothetical protein
MSNVLNECGSFDKLIVMALVAKHLDLNIVAVWERVGVCGHCFWFNNPNYSEKHIKVWHMRCRKGRWVCALSVPCKHSKQTLVGR